MQDNVAAGKADDFIRLMLQHQMNLFGSAPLNDPENAQSAAKALAALRAELIKQLTSQG
jgi:hypothetical protein